MIPWIQVYSNLPMHQKTARLADELGLASSTVSPDVLAVGLLVSLWTWAVQNARDGDLSKCSPRLIATACHWKKKPEALIKGLQASGFLDEDMKLHDWYEYAGKLIERMDEEKAYKNRRNALYNDMRLIKAVRARDGDFCRYCGKKVNWNDKRGPDGGTYDHVDPDGDNSLENIVVACRSCNSRKKDRTPEEANMPLTPI